MSEAMIEVEPVEGHTPVREDDPRVRITGPTLVPDTAYYRRMIAKGGLRRVEKKPARARASQEG